MEEIIKKAKQITAIYNGEISVFDAHDDVQKFFEMSVAHMAYCIAVAPKEQRKQMVDDVPDLWREDTSAMARQLVRAVKS